LVIPEAGRSRSRPGGNNVESSTLNATPSTFFPFSGINVESRTPNATPSTFFPVSGINLESDKPSAGHSRNFPGETQ
jgi:hypothetical protein